MQILTIYSPNNANLDNFFPKKGNFGQFFTSESEESEEICSQFFSPAGEKIDFLAEYSPLSHHALYKKINR